MQARVTQRDVARAAGVSFATVSLALRNSATLPAETRRRIRKIATQLGYTPDPMLAVLAAYRMRQRPAAYHANIAWINTWDNPEGLHAPDWDFTDYFVGAEARARELGYQLEEICLSEIGHKPRRLEKVLSSKGITGLLLPPCQHAGGELDLDFRTFSAVRFGYSYRRPVLHTVMNDQFHTAFDAFRNILSMGYRRPSIILKRDLDERTSWNFLGGFVTAQRFVPREDRAEPFYPSTDSAEELLRWVDQHQVDCLIGFGHWSRVKHAGLSGRIGYADLSVPRSDSVFTGMHQNSIRIGATAVDFLVSMMRSGETGLPPQANDICIKSRWVEGSTLPRRIHDQRDAGPYLGMSLQSSAPREAV